MLTLKWQQPYHILSISNIADGPNIFHKVNVTISTSVVKPYIYINRDYRTLEKRTAKKAHRRLFFLPFFQYAKEKPLVLHLYELLRDVRLSSNRLLLIGLYGKN
jgi:hypothetical protein